MRGSELEGGLMEMTKEDTEILSDIIRVEGRLYSVNEIIEDIAERPITMTNTNKIFSVLLFVIFYCVLGLMNYSMAGVLAVAFALFVHEMGHFIGMKTVGSSRAVFVFLPLFGPIAVTDEGVSAGRKSVVALSGPAFGLVAGMMAVALNNRFNYSFCLEVARPLLFLSAINLLPIKPFDGWAVAQHLIFIRYPKLEMGFLAIGGAIIFLSSFFWTIHNGLSILSLFFCMYGGCMFAGIKKIDNFSDMITNLRCEASEDLEKGRFSPGTIKRMQFFFGGFDLSGKTALCALLREIFDRAREVPASKGEVIGVVSIYLLLIFACVENPVVKGFGLTVMEKL